MMNHPGTTNLEPETPRAVLLSSDQLVDREEQLAKFTDVLDRIRRQGPVASNLFEYYGSPGIGKSVLVRMLAERADKKEAVRAIVNFKQPEEKIRAYLQDPITLVDEIVTDLKRDINLDTLEFNTALQEYRNATPPDGGVVSVYSAMDQGARLYQRPDWLTKLRDVIIAFIKLVNTLPVPSKANGVRPVVLFFDETEHADIEFVDWIEEWIVNPLIQIKHCVVVWTARRPWRWKRPEVRRRLTSEMLQVFEEKQMQEQIRVGSAEPDLVADLFKNVHSLTGGHPFAGYIVISELDVLAKQGETITPDNFRNFESKLLGEVFDRFVNHYAFSELESDDLKIACKFLSLVRLFDSTMLRRILQACAGDYFAQWVQDDFGELLLKLKKTQLLVWEKGYAIDPGLRHIIQKYFMVLDPDTFVRANQAALDVYDDWLKRPVDNRSLFVLEELYHTAALQQPESLANLHALLMKRLKEYPDWIRDEQALQNALDRLENEIKKDGELDRFVSSRLELAEQVQVFRATRFSGNQA